MAAKKTGNTRRHFLGLSAAATGRLLAAAAVVSAAIPSRNAKAMGRRWRRYRDGGNQRPHCFLRGTLIATATGEVAVEALKIGDLVATAEGRHEPVRWIAHNNFTLTGRSWPKWVMPVRISAGALADGVPKRDLNVSPSHALLIDGVLIKAIDLVNGTTITQPKPDSSHIDFYHVMLSRHDAILAEGAAAETLLLEPGIYEQFTNGVEFVRLYPMETQTRMRRFAPVVAYGGRLHAKALVRRAFGGLVPISEPAERIYEKVLDRSF